MDLRRWTDVCLPGMALFLACATTAEDAEEPSPGLSLPARPLPVEREGVYGRINREERRARRIKGWVHEAAKTTVEGTWTSMPSATIRPASFIPALFLRSSPFNLRS